MKTSEILTKAADLIEPEGAWTQNYYARAKSGAPIGSSEANACSWCAIGALRKIMHPQGEICGPYGALFDVMGEAVGFWNDAPERTQSEVITAFRTAAANEAAKGN